MLPLTVQSVSVVVPKLARPPPLLQVPALPPVIVSPEIDAVTPRRPGTPGSRCCR